MASKLRHGLERSWSLDWSGHHRRRAANIPQVVLVPSKGDSRRHPVPAWLGGRVRRASSGGSAIHAIGNSGVRLGRDLRPRNPAGNHTTRAGPLRMAQEASQAPAHGRTLACWALERLNVRFPPQSGHQRDTPIDPDSGRSFPDGRVALGALRPIGSTRVEHSGKM